MEGRRKDGKGVKGGVEEDGEECERGREEEEKREGAVKLPRGYNQ